MLLNSTRKILFSLVFLGSMKISFGVSLFISMVTTNSIVFTDSTTQEECLTVYNQFSPNNDGVNDTFVITCIEDYPQSTLEVYNRWGSRIYSQKRYQNDWDGRSNVNSTINSSEQLPSGTYFYVLNLGNSSPPITGWLYINR